MRAAAAGLILAVFASTLALPVPSAAQLSQSDIEERLTCQCGCGLTVATCNHLQCSFAIPVREEIAEALAEGKDGEEIIDGFVEKYGEKVLSSPIPTGFNLLAWIAPYLAVFTAAALILWRIRRWTSSPGDDTDDTPPPSSLGNDERARLDRELEDSEP